MPVINAIMCHLIKRRVWEHGWKFITHVVLDTPDKYQTSEHRMKSLGVIAFFFFTTLLGIPALHMAHCILVVAFIACQY